MTKRKLLIIGATCTVRPPAIKKEGVNMDWNSISTIPKFLPLDKVFGQFGAPRFKLGNRPVYYMGQGFFLSYSRIQFKIENSERVEYGEPGAYVLSLYFFLYRNEFEMFFVPEQTFEFEGKTLGEPFVISDEIKVGLTFEKLAKLLKTKSGPVYYREGETKFLDNASGKFLFKNNWIAWDNYDFYFFGKSRHTKMTAFQYTFKDQT